MRIDERVLPDLAARTRFGDVRVLGQVDSTNAVARQAAEAGAPEGLVVATDHQTAGRGRLGRTWDLPAGAGLAVSVLLRPALAPERLHLLTAAVALAAADACARVGGFAPELKWPNDLLVDGAKLAGILAEVGGPAAAPWVVVGCGLNVASAPSGAVAADTVAGRALDPGVLLVALLDGIEDRYGHWDALAGEYRRRCATVGRRVRVEQPGRTTVGTAVGLDDAGRLLVRPDVAAPATTGAAGPTDGPPAPVAFSAGDVVHLRPAEGSAGPVVR